MADRDLGKVIFTSAIKSIVGYGYLGEHNGPFASLDANDFPAILAHAETEAADIGNGVQR